MPRSIEIKHFAQLLASLTVTAARASSVERLAEVHMALEDAFVDVFTLLSHDAADVGLIRDLNAVLQARAERAAEEVPA